MRRSLAANLKYDNESRGYSAARRIAAQPVICVLMAGILGTIPLGGCSTDSTAPENQPPSPETGNQPPVAAAGPDQTVTDVDGGGDESVMLDGSGSSDPDGSITSYVWIEGGQEIATGPTPTVTLVVGTHNITLRVTDNDGATGTDDVVITVNP